MQGLTSVLAYLTFGLVMFGFGPSNSGLSPVTLKILGYVPRHNHVTNDEHTEIQTFKSASSYRISVRACIVTELKELKSASVHGLRAHQGPEGKKLVAKPSMPVVIT